MLKEKYIGEIEISEIDLEPPFYKDGSEDGEEVEWSDEVRWQTTHPIDIDEAINSLQTLKDKGSNRVYIVAHEGHIGYIFTGVDLKEE